MATTTLDYLLPYLRLRLGDTDDSAYRYADAWLLVALHASAKTLQSWMNFKYLMNEDNEVYRNSHAPSFIFPEPPVIELQDEEPIVLMACIIVKGGTLENSSWDLGSWRDAEISVSNIEGGKSRSRSLDRDWAALTAILKPPQKRLAQSKKMHLLGYKPGSYERKDSR